MSKSNRKDIVVSEWIREFSAYMAGETQKLLDEQQKHLVTRDNNAVFKSFLENLITVFVLKSLKKRPEGKSSQQDLLKFTSTNFATMKLDVQESVAKGFQEAMGIYSKVYVDYYCQIKTVPAPVNKEPC